MKIAAMIKQALERKKFRNLKDASKYLGISPELLRVIVNKSHIPKDKTLSIIANKLALDKSVLILSAHQEKVPPSVKGYFLSPLQTTFRHGKRVSPLSSEQCDYLAKIMDPIEIQLLRKYRQISEEAKVQFAGYVDFLYSTKKEV